MFAYNPKRSYHQLVSCHHMVSQLAISAGELNK